MMKPPSVASALKAALDILYPLSEVSKSTMGILNSEVGIARSRVRRAVARIEITLNNMERKDAE